MTKWQWDRLEKEIEEAEGEEKDKLAEIENDEIDRYLEKSWRKNESN